GRYQHPGRPGIRCASSKRMATIKNAVSMVDKVCLHDPAPKHPPCQQRTFRPKAKERLRDGESVESRHRITRSPVGARIPPLDSRAAAGACGREYLGVPPEALLGDRENTALFPMTCKRRVSSGLHVAEQRASAIATV